jgi:hypothetical protein
VVYNSNNSSGDPSNDFNYRAGLNKKYRKALEGVEGAHDNAIDASKSERRRGIAETLAASNSRNLGALGDVSEQGRKQAADSAGIMSLDKYQAKLGSLETLQEMDTPGSLAAKTLADYETMISNYATDIAGTWNEQAETAKYIRDTLIPAAKAQKDTASVAQLTLRANEIAKGGGFAAMIGWGDGAGDV